MAPVLRLLPLLLLLGTDPSPGQSVAHLRSILTLQGMALDWAAADVNGDGLKDLFVALRRPDGRREIAIFRMRKDGALPSIPDHLVELKTDIVSWGVGDFRPEEPGVELLLTTRRGAFTLSPRKSTYRDNVRRVVKVDMLLDLVSDRDCPRWPAIADVDGDGVDEIALATIHGLMVVGVDGRILGEIPMLPNPGRRPAVTRAFKIGSAKLNAQPLAGLLVPDEDPGVIDPPPILYAKDSQPQPFLYDADGDGRLDLFYYRFGSIRVHLLQARGVGNGATWLGYDKTPDVTIRIVDGGDWKIHSLDPVQAGGGPGADLMITRSEKGGLLTSDWQVLIYFDAFGREDPLAQPDALVTADASWARASLVDLNGDEHPDLALTAWSLTLAALGLQGVDIEHEVQGYFSIDGKGFSDRASFKSYEREYAADDFTAFSLVPAFNADLNGDGRTDLLSVDGHGSLEFHRFDSRKGRQAFLERPDWTIKVDALTSLVDVQDLNGDGVGDIIILPEFAGNKPVTTFEVYVSKIR